ncbi:hypothetical protein HGA34_00960 [Candidatus Falkowbacteria bacterium]|nr:hypothetical protein [Candidatus Falkowbacteria bacterium]
MMIGLFSINSQLLDQLCRGVEGVRVTHAHWNVAGGELGFVDLVRLCDEFKDKQCEVIFLDCSGMHMVNLFAWGLLMSQADSAWMKGFALINAGWPIISFARMLKLRANLSFFSRLRIFTSWPPCFEQ